MHQQNEARAVQARGASSATSAVFANPLQRMVALFAMFAITLAMASAALPTRAFANPLEDAGNAIASFFGLTGDDEATVLSAGQKTSSADESTLDSWRNYLTDADGNYTTQNIGRIWTDKTVADEDIELPASADGKTFTIPVGNSDFLVALSALSSTSNTTTTVSKPLDIVFVLDVSGSMEYGFGKVYSDDLDTSKTYLADLGNDNYQEVSYDSSRRAWGYSLWGRWQTVTPKTSENSRGSQFYNSSRLEALQEAANAFIDATNAQNQNFSSSAEKHRISIVTYASSASTVQSFSSDADRLTNAINGLDAGGGTYSNYGMQRAEQVMRDARDDAQKVVLFFTDGTPGRSGWNDTVANGAISSARNLKNNDTLVYSVGIFDGADANPNTSNENAYMNGVSSNYPNATAYNRLGDRVEDGNYYLPATNADELTQIFQNIFDEVSSSLGSPTTTIPDDPFHSGYVTFTDQLGAYMKVDEFKSIVFADYEFKQVNKETSGNTDTYTFQGQVTEDMTGGLYQTGSLDSILITVERSSDPETGDKVTVKVPAALIPLRNFEVDQTAEGTTTLNVTEQFPIRIFYGVSLKDDAKTALLNGDADMAAYVEKNISEDGTSAYFYSNLWNGSDNGDTVSAFEPASTNNFYNFGSNTYLYTDQACTKPAIGSIDPNGTYYYKMSYYVKNAATAEVEQVTDIITLPAQGSVLTMANGSYVATDASTGQLYVKADSPRIQRVNDVFAAKKNNVTGTATNVINPTWSEDYDSISTLLGNNGRLAVELPGTLEVSKTVTVPEGFDIADYEKVDFKFQIECNTLSGDYWARVFDSTTNEAKTDLFKLHFDAEHKATQSLKHNETLVIYGLDAGSDYTVTELEIPKGFTQSSPAAGDAETGTIEPNAVDEANFENTYTVQPYELAADQIKAQKILNGRGWTDKDSYDLRLWAVDGAPLPAGEQTGDQGGRYVSLTTTDGTEQSFGNITYTTPGTYVYYVYENIPTDRLPGISYSNAAYRVTVTVSDNHDGTLSATVDMVQGIADNGNRLDPAQAADIAIFTNTYNANEVESSFTGVKNYTDNSGGNKPLQDNMFKFKVTPITAGAPVPDEAEDDGSLIVGHTGTTINFDLIPFELAHAGNEYQYKVTEVVPDEATNPNVAGKTYADATDDERATAGWTYQGMTYDTTVWTATATLTLNNNGTPDDVADDVLDIAWNCEKQNSTDAPQQGVVFSNSYNVAPVTLEGFGFVTGYKTLTGRDMLANETFDFTLMPADDLTAAAVEHDVVTLEDGDTASSEVSGARNGVAQSFDFGDATFTMPGTYTFIARETGMNGTSLPADGTNGLTFDRADKTVTVTVTDNNGQLEADVQYADGDAVNFENTYNASFSYNDAGGLTVGKVLNGRAMSDQEFEFAITATGDNSDEVDEADAKLQDRDRSFKNRGNREDGQEWTSTSRLRGLNFTQDDAGKTFSYLVDEVTSDGNGVDADQSQYRVDVQVVDNNDGTMHTVTTVTQVMDKDGNELTDGTSTVFDSSRGEAARVPNFVNEYSADSVDVDLDTDAPLYKVIDGRDWTDSDEFTFNVSKVSYNGSTDADALDAMPAPATPVTVATPENGAKEGDRVPFGIGSLTFDRVGTYVYQVTEEGAGTTENGLTYSSNTATITVVVTDNGQGQLEATASVVDDTFTNTYGVKMSYNEAVNLIVSKVLNGHDMAAEQFNFKLGVADDETAKKVGLGGADDFGTYTNREGAKDGQKVTMTANNYPMDLTQEDDGQTYTFFFTEEAGDAAGYTYDAVKYTVAITTKDNLNGTLTVTTVVTTERDGESTAETYEWTTGQDPINVELPFVNTYTAGDSQPLDTSALFSKVLEGRDWFGSDTFNFTLTPLDGAPEPETLNASVSKGDVKDGKAAFGFGNIVFTAADMEGATVNAGGIKVKTFTYEVTEDAYDIAGVKPKVANQKATLTVTVRDDGSGQLIAATPRVENGEFVNVYTTDLNLGERVNANISKVLTGHAMTEGQFEFTAKADEATAKLLDLQTDPVKSVVAADGETVTMGDLIGENAKLTPEDEGTYKFTVEETKGGDAGYTNDAKPVTVTVNVVYDEATGVLSAEIAVTKDGEQIGETIKVTSADEDTTVRTVTAPFYNTYSASTENEGGTSAKVSSTKTLNGRPLEAGEFRFTVNYVDSEASLSDVFNAADGTVDFGTFTFDTETIAREVANGHAKRVADVDGKPAWEFAYTATEMVPENFPAGVTVSKGSFNFTITVVDNGDGTMTATANLPEDHGFVNTYSATGEDGNPVSVTPTGTKVLDAAEGLTPGSIEGKFTFTLEALNGGPLPTETTATNDAQGNVTFGAIPFSLDDLNAALGTTDATEGDATEGTDAPATQAVERSYTFTYRVTESGSADGVTNDAQTTREFSYTLTDDGLGHLTVTANPAQGPLFTFTNTYSVDETTSSVTDQLTVSKVLEGRDMAAEEFNFEMVDAEGTVVATATNGEAADGELSTLAFTPVTFTEPGDYTYTLREVTPIDEMLLGGVTYDATTFAVTAHVVDNGDGTLSVTWESEADELTFANVYEAAETTLALGASKVLEGRDLKDGEFTFLLTYETADGEKTIKATNDANGQVVFPNMTFGAAGTYSFSVKEQLPTDDDPNTEGVQKDGVTYDETVYEQKVVVTDDGLGQLKATIEGEAAVFTNTYVEPVEPEEPKGDLPTTGDPMTLATLGALGAAGLGAMGCGAYLSRRKRK